MRVIRSRILTHTFSVATTVVGFVAEPVPALDEILVVPMQYTLVALIPIARGESPFRAPWLKASAIIWGGVAVRFVSEVLLRHVPVAGMASNAILTFASTEILGHYVDHALDLEHRA